ncbi:hypothetical protein [Bdellovibrio sp. HCB337]|uniref:hypothetical protein n=1 Tax=Bdellovibrio sp. HCB337 TaxID=3394358 RepID=UPI0039A60EEA
MKPWGFFFLASLLASNATMAQDLSIVDVRRHITLSDDDVVYKDFYINGGESDGLKKNLVVTAVRKIQVRDSSGSQSYGEIQVPVGQLRIIATYGKVSVAREYKLLSRDELPMLEQTGLMNGDKIEIKGAFMDNSKPIYKKKTAEVIAPKETAVVAVVTAPATTTAPAPVVVAVAPQGPAPASVAPAEPKKLEKTADAGAAKAQ